MSAGTLTLTNGSAVVGGSGTSFATELAAGDFIVSTVGGVPYTLPVKTVDSNTQLTLVSNYTGPTQSGAAWSAVPRVALNMVTAALVAQSAEALRGLNYDKQNWQAVFSASGDIKVMLPDGTTFTGPSWKSIIDILNSIDIDVAQQLADRVRADAQQVSSDKQAVQSAAKSASTDRSAAESANSGAELAEANAKIYETNAAESKRLAEAAMAGAELAEANAKIYETNAAESKRLAEAARDAANSSAGIYKDTTSGLAGTATGGYFSVPSPLDDEVLILYRNDAGIATEVKRYPSAVGIENMRVSMMGVAASLVLTQSIIAAHHAFL